MKLKTVFLMAGVCLLTLSRPALADPNLVLNGDFSLPGFIAWDPGPSNDGAAYYAAIAPNPSPVPDWTMTPAPGPGGSCGSDDLAFCFDSGVDYEDLGYNPLNPSDPIPNEHGYNSFVIDANSLPGPSSQTLPGGTLSQTLSTTIGTQYELTYWLELVNFCGDGTLLCDAPDNAFGASWDGIPIGGSIISNINADACPSGYPCSDGAFAFGWTEYSFVVTGTGSDTLSFTGFSDDSELAYALTDISVTSVPVPEPTTLVLLGTGLFGVVLLRWKCRNA